MFHKKNYKINVNINIKTHNKLTRLILLNKVKNIDYKVNTMKSDCEAIISFSTNLFILKGISTIDEDEKEKIRNNPYFIGIYLYKYSKSNPDLEIIFRTEKMNISKLFYQYDEIKKETTYMINYIYSENPKEIENNKNIIDQDENINYYQKYHGNDINECPTLFIFLIDQSGSMTGDSIKLVKESLLIFMESLPKNSYFQLIGFGTEYKKYNEKPLKYEEENIKSTLNIINELNADLGGTDVYKPLKDIFDNYDNLYKDINLPKNILILTDGEISDKEKTIELISNNNLKITE